MKAIFYSIKDLEQARDSWLVIATDGKKCEQDRMYAQFRADDYNRRIEERKAKGER